MYDISLVDIIVAFGLYIFCLPGCRGIFNRLELLSANRRYPRLWPAVGGYVSSIYCPIGSLERPLGLVPPRRQARGRAGAVTELLTSIQLCTVIL